MLLVDGRQRHNARNSDLNKILFCGQLSGNWELGEVLHLGIPLSLVLSVSLQRGRFVRVVVTPESITDDQERCVDATLLGSVWWSK